MEQRTKKMLWRIPLFVAIIFAIFWGIWFLVSGSIPHASQDLDASILPNVHFPFSVSRGWDVVFAPIWIVVLILLFVFSEFINNKIETEGWFLDFLHRICYYMTEGASVGLIVGLIVGLFKGMVFAPLIALIVGSVLAMGIGLIWYLILFLLWAFCYLLDRLNLLGKLIFSEKTWSAIGKRITRGFKWIFGT